MAESEAALRAQVEGALRAGRPADAVEPLVRLMEVTSAGLFYCSRLGVLLESLGRVDEAIQHYRRLLQRSPGLAAGHFNLALLYRKNKEYDAALAEYQRAIDLGIDRAEEVYSNMGVLYSEMRRAGPAREMYERALSINDAYVPALFNLAGLLEELGSRQAAIALYERILAIDPGHWESLARLAYAQRITDRQRELVARIEQAAEAAGADPLGQEALYFALGKARDDLGEYEAAFAAYQAANRLGKKRNRPYDPGVIERLVDELIRGFNADWLANVGSASEDSPIFICGMPRSGSTLIEQVLAAHPGVQTGGELDFLPWLLGRRLTPYPQRAFEASRSEIAALGETYMAKLRELFPDASHVTDKRPDNFLHIGIIKAAFPRARIIYTRRQVADNCLSVYFQQLGANLHYATSIEDTAHYYRQHERLMAHWSSLPGKAFFTVDYDELVTSPRPVLEALLEFLGLPWDDRCLAFQDADVPVKTASVWQVREPLHTRSSGRWRNYAAWLPGIGADS